MAESFDALGIDQGMVEVLRGLGISQPTPIQERVIPALLQGKDVIGQAQTGTGKTLGFLLPIMAGISLEEAPIQALIVAPTRELAIQISTEARKLAKANGANILAVYGGQDVDQQVRKLKGRVQIVIATPGRLLDHLRRGTIAIDQVKFLVLDEADQMLHMGFLNEVEEIIRKTPETRQNMFFSATMPKEIRSLAAKYMKDPLHIQALGANVTLGEIKQVVVEVTDRTKQRALVKKLEELRPYMAMIFCRTKRRASDLNMALAARGYNCQELHGDLTQGKREKVMKAFRAGKIQYLVATDVAARGLDIEGITHVFNYDIPQDAESYIHRIGRTGRAGQEGMAITFVAPKDRGTLMLIEKGIRMTIQRERIQLEPEAELVETYDASELNRRDKDKHKGRNHRTLKSKDSQGYRGKKASGGERPPRGNQSNGKKGNHSPGGKKNNPGKGKKGFSGKR